MKGGRLWCLAAVVGVVLLLYAGPAWGQTYGPPGLPAPPPVSAPVLDETHVLKTATVGELDRQLGAANTSSNGQVAIAVVDSTGGLTIAKYAQMLFNYWGVGHATTNDGVLIVLDMSTHQVRVQTGSGLQERFPNSEAQSIIDTDMLPSLRAGDPDRAVSDAAAAVESGLGIRAVATTQGQGHAEWPYVIGWTVIGGGILGGVAWLTLRGKRQVGMRPGHTPPRYSPGGGWGGGGGGGGFGGGASSGGGATGSW